MIDRTWLAHLRDLPDLATRDTLVIDGVEVELPKTNARGRDRARDWQRRILPDIIPDSVNADAPERTPFRLLYSLTSGIAMPTSIERALEGHFAPLEDLFRAETQTSSKKKMTLAFHVLAVKAAAKGEADAKGFTERTLLLLFRKEDGHLDQGLLRELIEQFRQPPSKLDLAQRTLLDRLFQGSWSPEMEPGFALPDWARVPEVPFDPKAARLFREDVRSLIDADLAQADFFQQLNHLLIVHLGLYQSRVAALLNPQMELLFREMERPDPRNLRDLEANLAEYARHHPFDGQVVCRAPDPEQRPVTLQSPERRSFEEQANALAVFHFNVLLLVQLRRIAETWFAHRWNIVDDWRRGALEPDQIQELAGKVRGPREILAAMADDAEFAAYLHRVLAAFAARFVQNQIVEADRQGAYEDVERAASGLHALQRLYERYNAQSSSNKANSRAYRQGTQIMSSLLRHKEHGLVQGRPRVGPYFEIGAGLLPLLLLLTVGPVREKVPVSTLWRRLADYGLRFERAEQERLLARLRAMGVYERYSDAGEAAYVRNLMTATRAA
jgi:hypothetical protein